jgi:Protein of unknown function (DUF1353)
MIGSVQSMIGVAKLVAAGLSAVGEWRLLYRMLVPCSIVWLSAGCASWHYSRTEPGTLSGKLLVQWIDADRFRFLPDAEQPLTFVRADGESIRPGQMYTDGGSIPRPLWALRSYSPWGYAPAFIVHDWLFEMHHCGLPGNEAYDVEEAAQVMSEVMKTMAEAEPAYRNTLAVYTMYEAVRSPIAVDVWNSGSCVPPPPQRVAPRIEYEISWPPPSQ